DQLSGVARSSRAGTKRSVKAGPTTRPWPGLSGLVPRIQTLRRPFFRRTVVSVAVETPFSVSTIFGSSDMESPRHLEGPSLPSWIFPAAFPSVKEANDHFRPLRYGWAFCGKMATFGARAPPMSRVRIETDRERKWCRLQDSNLRPHHYE